MNEDMLNVMGSFISTELDAFENLHKELEEKDKEIEKLKEENNLLKQRNEKAIERLNNNWNKLKNELENILFFDNDTITYEDLMDIINRIEESDK